MEEAKATTPGFGAVGDSSGLLYTEHPDAGISLVLASAQPQERGRKELQGVLAIPYLMPSTFSPSQLIFRALNSGVEYYWDQLNETVFTVHSSSRSSERPG